MDAHFTPSLARTLERIEIVRSSLRWSPVLDRNGIDKILRQMDTLRSEVLLLSRGNGGQAGNRTGNGTPSSLEQRRKALADSDFQFDGVFGESEKILETLEVAAKVARTDLPVLIEGESGTGKELLAKVVHANGSRSEKPLITVNCGAISPNLLESELFGHVRGAFTGAAKDREGRFEAANRGTIFLDEIGELPPEGQVKLLRVLESGEIQRVGADKSIMVDVRIIAATNRNLMEMMAGGRFREDLYYRLGVIPLMLPPLRERRDELPLLIDFFCREVNGRRNGAGPALSARLRSCLMGYDYPGNIRELRNIISHIVCVADGEADLEDLPPHLRRNLPQEADKAAKERARKATATSLEEVRNAAIEVAERAFLEDQLREVEGNVTTLSKRLGMNRSYLQVLLKRRGLRSKAFKQSFDDS